MDSTEYEAGIKLLRQQSLPDLETAKRLLAEAVAEKGADYVYPEDEKRGGICQYASGGKPSCIVGNVLARAGWTIEALAAADKHVLWEYVARADDDAYELLFSAQNRQDVGVPWGQAVLAALDDIGAGR